MNVFELLLNAARLVGVRVIVVPGADGRGQGVLRRLEVVVMHHTADGPVGDYPSKDVVTFGRAGLNGLLSQLGLGRSGSIYIMGSGIAWHAGPSDWAGFYDLNDESIGIEAESVGTRDDWTAEQRDIYPRLVAALLYYMRRGADRAAFHREVANPPGRKIDPAYWYNPQTRNLIAWYLADPLNRIPKFANPTPPQDVSEGVEPMNLESEYDDERGIAQLWGPCEGVTPENAWKGSWLLVEPFWGDFTSVHVFFFGDGSGNIINKTWPKNVVVNPPVPKGSQHVIIEARYKPPAPGELKPRISAGWVAVPK